MKKFWQWTKLWLKQAYHEWDAKDNLEQVQIVTGLITISTAICTAYTYIIAENNKTETARKQDLATYQNYGAYVKQYQEEIQPDIARFLSDFQVSYYDESQKTQVKILLLNDWQIQKLCQSSKQLSKNCSFFQISNNQNNNIQPANEKNLYFKIEKNPSPDLYDETINIYSKETPERNRFDEACQALLSSKKSRTGIEVFYSDKFDKYRKIHNFFEILGLSIKNNLIQFDSVFNMFNYPANWNDYKPSIWAQFDPFFEIEACLRKNWFGENKQKNDDKSLLDFSDNFLQLGTNYHYTRVINKYNSLDCKLWWQKWKQGPKKGNEEICQNLIQIKDQIEKEHIESNLVVKQLYNPGQIVSIRKFWFHSKRLIIALTIIIVFIIVWHLSIKFINKRN